MIENGILDLIVGLASFVGIVLNIRVRHISDTVCLLPEFLVALLLTSFGTVRIMQFAYGMPVEMIHTVGILLFFLPVVYALNDNAVEVGPARRPVLAWFLPAVLLTLAHLIINYIMPLGQFDDVLEVIIALFFGLSILRFKGFQRFVLITAILIWGSFHLTSTIDFASHLIIILGSIVFYKMNYSNNASVFDNFDFKAEDFIDANVHPFIILNLSGRIVYANNEFALISGYDRKDLIGREAIDLFEIPSNWVMKINPNEGFKKIRCQLLTRGKEKIPILLWLNEINKFGKALKNLVCFIYDESEYQMMEKKINAEARRFAGLHETSKALSSSLEMNDVLEAIASAAETLTDSDTCTLFSLDHSRQVIRPLYSTEQDYSDEVMNFELPIGQGLTGRVVGDGKARIQNYDDETDLAVHIPGTSDEEESIICAPLLAKNVVIGALTLYKTGKKRFNKENLETLSVFASQAASALETSRLYMKLKDSEKVYRSSVDLAGDGIMFVDTETGKITDANEAAKKMLDYTRSELVAKYIWELHPQPLMQTARQLWQSVKKNGKDIISEIQYESRSGRVIPASVNASMIATGDLEFIQWVVRDMSEYKRIIDKMGFFQKILTNLTEPVMITDNKGSIYFANRALKEIFSVDLELGDYSGKEKINIRSLRIPALDEITDKLQLQSSYAGEISLNSGRGGRDSKMVHILPNYDPGSKLTYFFWTFYTPERGETSSPDLLIAETVE